MIDSHISFYYTIKMKDDRYLSNLIGAFATAVSTNMERELMALGGKSLNHEMALITIHNHPNETIDIVSKILALTHSGAVRLINSLEQEGLVNKHKSKTDARAAVLAVTEKGRQRVEKILAIREANTSSLLQHFDDEQKQTLTELIETSLNSLTDTKIEARRICRLCNEGICRQLGCPVELAVTQE